MKIIPKYQKAGELNFKLPQQQSKQNSEITRYTQSMGILNPTTLKSRLQSAAKNLKVKYNNLSTKERLALAKKNRPHSEIVTVKDRYGNIKTSTNPQAGAMSGVDPVGEFIVGTTVGNLGLGLGKIVLSKMGNNAISYWARNSLLNEAARDLTKNLNNSIMEFNPKQIKAISNKPKEFKSELDWSPKSWFEDAGDWRDYTQTDIDALVSHTPEYHEIEKISKANGTWLKMPDGSTWKGDPRSWVQLMSKNGQKLSKTVYWHGDTDKYITTSGEDVTPIENGKRILWGNSKPHIARSYTNSDSKVMPFVLKANQQPLKEIDAEGRIWKSAYKKNGEYYDTNTFSLENLKNGEYLVINNVIDKGSMFIPKNSKYYISSQPNESYTDYLIRTQKGNDIIVGKNTSRKFLVGNNGNFNLLDPNVFKISVPIITFSAYDEFSK